MLQKIKNNFNPLLFLASLGSGGIAVAGFIIIQYGGIFTGKGLATFSDIIQTPIVIFLEANMILFAFLHILLTILFFIAYLPWKKTNNYLNYKENPLVNSGLIAPLLSLAMTMNVFIAVIRYFIPFFSYHFQEIIAPAFLVFIFLWGGIVYTSIYLLKKAFVKYFDIDKIHFGWLLQPFALAMVTVTASGFAALAKNTETIFYNNGIASFSAFLALVSGGMALFLTLVKIFSIFKKHFAQEGTLEYQFMPTYLILIPIFTLFGISVFRLGHFAEHFFHEPIFFVFAKIILLFLYAFELWYFVFGFFMLKGYYKKYLKKTFHVSQWGLICPFVAFLALSAFVFKIFFSNSFSFILLLLMFIFVVVLFLYLLKKQFSCFFKLNSSNRCE